MMTSQELQEIRNDVGTRKNVKQIKMTDAQLKLLQGYCIKLLEHIDELRAEYVNPYNNPAAGWE